MQILLKTFIMMNHRILKQPQTLKRLFTNPRTVVVDVIKITLPTKLITITIVHWN